MQSVNYFAESNDLLDDPLALRKRLRDDGYLFLRDLLPREEVLALRSQILECCRDAGWLRKGSDPMDALTDHPPILEGDEEWLPIYARVQSLEAFHRLKLNARVHHVMEDLFQEPVFALPMTIARIAFPNDNDRGTQPHQDWPHVGGSTEIISCWAPLGDVPVEVGGLKILKGSHKAGFFTPRPASGPGGDVVDADPSLDWVQSDYRAGDLLLFKALTVHGAALNHTPDVLRISSDFRYAGISHTIKDTWLQPHFHWAGDQFTWDALDRAWRASPTARYWQKIPNIKTASYEPIKP